MKLNKKLLLLLSLLPIITLTWCENEWNNEWEYKRNEIKNTSSTIKTNNQHKMKNKIVKIHIRTRAS